MNEQLKLIVYAFEKFVIGLPEFPGKKSYVERKGVSVKWSSKITSFVAESDKNKLAVRLQLFLKPHYPKKGEPRISLEVSLVGVFKKTGKSKNRRTLMRHIAPSILYPIIKEQVSHIVSNSIIRRFEMPEKLPSRKK